MFFMARMVTGSLHYFQLSSTSLIVRKFMRRKVVAYPITDITEVKFLKVKLAIHVMINTATDSKTYPAATLSKDTLRELQQALDARGVNITQRMGLAEY